MTISQLKSFLTDQDVVLPPQSQRKQYYLTEAQAVIRRQNVRRDELLPSLMVVYLQGVPVQSQARVDGAPCLTIHRTTHLEIFC